METVMEPEPEPQPTSKFPPIPPILYTRTAEFSEMKTAFPTVDDQLYDLYGDEDDLEDEPPTLIDLPTTLIFYYNPTKRSFSAALPIVNKTKNPVTYFVYPPKSCTFEVEPVIGLLEGNKNCFVNISTPFEAHDASLNHFAKGYFRVQVMACPPDACTLPSSIRMIWLKNRGSAAIESHKITNLLFVKKPKKYKGGMDVIDAFMPPTSVPSSEDECDQEPTWVDLEEKHEYVKNNGGQIELIENLLENLETKSPLSESYVPGIQNHVLFVGGTALILLVTFIIFFIKKFF